MLLEPELEPEREVELFELKLELYVLLESEMEPEREAELELDEGFVSELVDEVEFVYPTERGLNPEGNQPP